MEKKLKEKLDKIDEEISLNGLDNTIIAILIFIVGFYLAIIFNFEFIKQLLAMGTAGIVEFILLILAFPIIIILIANILIYALSAFIRKNRLGNKMNSLNTTISMFIFYISLVLLVLLGIVIKIDNHPLVYILVGCVFLVNLLISIFITMPCIYFFLRKSFPAICKQEPIQVRKIFVKLLKYYNKKFKLRIRIS
jgi:hypothetical protein